MAAFDRYELAALIRYWSRFLAPLIQLGGLPRPVQVLPVAGSRYFATPTVVGFPFLGALAARSGVALVAALPLAKPRSCPVRRYSAIASLILLTTPATSPLRASLACFSSLAISA